MCSSTGRCIALVLRKLSITSMCSTRGLCIRGSLVKVPIGAYTCICMGYGRLYKQQQQYLAIFPTFSSIGAYTWSTLYGTQHFSLHEDDGRLYMVYALHGRQYKVPCMLLRKLSQPLSLQAPILGSYSMPQPNFHSLRLIGATTSTMTHCLRIFFTP